MGNFKKRSFGGKDKKRFNGRNSGSDRNRRHDDRERQSMYKATCSDCGKTCEVPFRPSGDKPVFCSDCFEGKRGGDSRDSRRRSDGKFSERGSRPSFKEKTSFKKNTGSEELAGLKVQFAQMNETLTKILEALTTQETKDVPNIVEEKKPRKERALRKEVDKVALKEVVKKATAKSTQAAAKKKTSEKVVTKAVKKVAKKAPAKKVAKKAVAKKKTTKKK